MTGTPPESFLLRAAAPIARGFLAAVSVHQLAASAAPTAEAAKAHTAAFDSTPRWCRALQREGPFGVCSGSSSSGSSSWFALAAPGDGCSSFVLLLLLLLLADTAERLLPKLWDDVLSLLVSLLRHSKKDNTEEQLPHSIRAEVCRLEQQEEELQRQLKRSSPSSDFVAFARLQRQVAKVAAAKEACMQQLQQQQHSSSSSSDSGLWSALLWPILKPMLLANSWALMKPLLCWLLFKGLFGATVEIPTAQLAPLDAFGTHLALIFPFAYIVARICLNAVYRQLAACRARVAKDETQKKAA
ncbi:hypothetical protein Efla_005437 [Eimeria flavescens]